MRGTDQRSRKIAVVSDRGLNAHLHDDEARPKLIANLAVQGYGLIVLPPESVAGEVARTAVSYAVDQVQDYVKNGYAVCDALLPQDSGAVAEVFRVECRIRGLSLPSFTDC